MHLLIISIKNVLLCKAIFMICVLKYIYDVRIISRNDSVEKFFLTLDSVNQKPIHCSWSYHYVIKLLITEIRVVIVIIFGKLSKSVCLNTRVWSSIAP
jgi:hypothetical protein